MRNLPEYVPNTTISAITSAYLLVSVTLLLLTTQIRQRTLKIWSTGISLLSTVLTLFALIGSTMGSGFRILSSNVVTYYFAIATLLLLLAIEFSAMGLLLPRLDKTMILGDHWKSYIK